MSPILCEADLIFAFSVFTHLSHRAALTALKTLRRYVADDGMLAITIRPIEYWHHDPGTSPDQKAVLIASHRAQGFAFNPHNREPVVLEPLAAAGASLQVVMGYRYPGESTKAAVELYPVTGKKAGTAAQAAGMAAAVMPLLLVTGDDKPGGQTRGRPNDPGAHVSALRSLRDSAERNTVMGE